MASQPLTVIAKIKPEEEESLKQILETIGANLSENSFLRLAESRLTHFARLGIISDLDQGKRLLFTSNYDGDLEDYLEELLQLGNSEEIWNKCEGYRGKNFFSEFIKNNSYQAQAAYFALPDETVFTVGQKIAIRQEIEQFLNHKNVAQFLDFPGIKPFLNSLSQFPVQLPWEKKLGLGIFNLLEKFANFFRQIVEAIRQFTLKILNFLGGILGAPDRRRLIGEYTGVKIDNKRLQELTSAEEVNQLNHLHLVSTIKQGRLLRLKLVLFLINFAAKNLFPLGTLANIQSIHFAHWSIIDEGKHLLFVTHYDGSFDNYLGDFSDRASIGLNSIWNNVEGYPEAGAQDLIAFKQFFRNDQQPPSLVFYRAYELTVKNILRDRKIVDTLGANFNQQAVEKWLQNL